MEHDRKPLQGRIDKLYKLRTERVDAGDSRNRGDLVFADILAAEDAAGKRKVLAKLFDKNRELAGRGELVLACLAGGQAIGKSYFAIECRSITLVLCRIKRAAQQRFFCHRVADAERTERFAHLILLCNSEPFKVGKDQSLGRLCNVTHLCDYFFFLLSSYCHLFGYKNTLIFLRVGVRPSRPDAFAINALVRYRLSLTL